MGNQNAHKGASMGLPPTPLRPIDTQGDPIASMGLYGHPTAAPQPSQSQNSAPMGKWGGWKLKGSWEANNGASIGLALNLSDP